MFFFLNETQSSDASAQCLRQFQCGLSKSDVPNHTEAYLVRHQLLTTSENFRLLISWLVAFLLHALRAFPTRPPLFSVCIILYPFLATIRARWILTATDDEVDDDNDDDHDDDAHAVAALQY